MFRGPKNADCRFNSVHHLGSRVDRRSGSGGARPRDRQIGGRGGGGCRRRPDGLSARRRGLSASVGIARDKAYTAATFGVATDDLGKALSSSEILRDGIALRPGVILFAGGLPIVVDGEVAGGHRRFGRFRGRRQSLCQGRPRRTWHQMRRRRFR